MVVRTAPVLNTAAKAMIINKTPPYAKRCKCLWKKDDMATQIS